MHGFITLSDTTSYDKILCAVHNLIFIEIACHETYNKKLEYCLLLKSKMMFEDAFLSYLGTVIISNCNNLVTL